LKGIIDTLGFPPKKSAIPNIADSPALPVATVTAIVATVAEAAADVADPAAVVAEPAAVVAEPAAPDAEVDAPDVEVAALDAEVAALDAEVDASLALVVTVFLDCNASFLKISALFLKVCASSLYCFALLPSVNVIVSLLILNAIVEFINDVEVVLLILVIRGLYKLSFTFNILVLDLSNVALSIPDIKYVCDNPDTSLVIPPLTFVFTYTPPVSVSISPFVFVLIYNPVDPCSNPPVLNILDCILSLSIPVVILSIPLIVSVLKYVCDNPDTSLVIPPLTFVFTYTPPVK